MEHALLTTVVVFSLLMPPSWPLMEGFVRPGQNGFREANINKIEIGMTEAEVERLLNAKAGDHWGDGHTKFGILDVDRMPGDQQGTMKDWVGPNRGVRIWFTNTGRVKRFAIGGVWYFSFDGERFLNQKL